MRRFLPFLVPFLLTVPAAAADPLLLDDPCPGARSQTVFSSGHGVLENLLFDGAGNLYVTGDSKLRRFDPDGSAEIVLDGLRAPGGLAISPVDGALYMGIGNSAADSILRTAAAEVWRFPAGDPTVQHVVYASGLDMPNGMTFDADGNLYVSNDFGPSLVRVTGPGEWTEWADVYGTNGLVVHDGVVDAAITFDQSSPIRRIALDDPSDVTTVAELSAGAASLEPAIFAPSGRSTRLVPKGLDDMTMDDAGNLVVTANGSGELLRVDPDTGASCALASGLRNPSSVRVARNFGEHTGLLFVTDFGGALTIVAP